MVQKVLIPRGQVAKQNLTDNSSISISRKLNQKKEKETNVNNLINESYPSLNFSWFQESFDVKDLLNKKKINIILPTNKKLVDSFINDENDFSDIIADNSISVLNNDGISTSTMNTITRAMKDSKNKVVIDKIVKKSSANKKKIIDKDLIYSSFTQNQENEYSSKIIKAVAVNFKDKIESVFSYSLRPSFDLNSVFYSNLNGNIVLNIPYSNTSSYFNGVLVAKHLLKTNFSFSSNYKSEEITIPLFDSRSYMEFLEKNNFSSMGGNYLVRLVDGVEDVELVKINSDSSSYEGRLFLNEKFQDVGQHNDFDFILFVGVNPGNHVVNYISEMGDEWKKITFIPSDEIVYDITEIKDTKNYELEFLIENTLSKKYGTLQIADVGFNYFNSSASFIQTGLNNVQLKDGISSIDSRSYIEIKHLEDPILIGFTDDNTKLVTPSKEFINEVLKVKELNESGIGSQCIIQINLIKQVKEIKHEAFDKEGRLSEEYFYLDNDGIFNEDLSPFSVKAFFVGTSEGVYSFKIKYLDGTVEIFQTFCSEGTYLVEQL